MLKPNGQSAGAAARPTGDPGEHPLPGSQPGGSHGHGRLPTHSAAPPRVTSPWILGIVRLSDSFEHAVTALLTDLGATVATSSAIATDGTLILAGGAEPQALEWLASHASSEAPVWVIGSLPDHRLASTLLQQGASDYFSLPDDLDLLRRTLERQGRTARSRQATADFAASELESSGFGAMIGEHPALRRTIDQGRRVAQHGDVSVLIGGETGTGKELLARAIHYESPRARAPFIEVNCTAIPANLLESELFGHEKGAFTGAVAAKTGLFEAAHGGTLFLDEIGPLPMELQPKLLRALESRTIRRVGSVETRAIDVRIVAATHVDLAAAARRGEFREDLFYRLNVVTLTLPPLRDRASDIERLAQAFVHQLATRYRMPVPALTPVVRFALSAYSWPGNVRELRNALERALVLSPPGTIDVAELPSAKGTVPAVASSDALPFPADLATITRAAAGAMLARCDGNKSEAARRLGISRPRLQRLLDGVSDD